MSHYSQASYMLSAPGLAQAPSDQGREVAFAGRSNAGKSSVLNVLTRQRGLARTSKTPGRTQLINFFSLSEDQRLVDLPGYGFAKVPKKVRERWQQELAHYLEARESLAGLVLLMDVRNPFTEYDEQMLRWTIESRLPVHVLLNKADKLKRGPAGNVLLKARKICSELSPDVSVQLFSALKRTGMEELETVLDAWLGYNDP